MMLSTDISAPGICFLSAALQTPTAKVKVHWDAAIWAASAMDRSPSRVLIRNAISSVSPFGSTQGEEVR
jgi:hypothetical protein